jgi:Secretion system C-terminal sorting domain
MVKANATYTAQIFDATGKLVQTKEISLAEQINSIDVSAFNTGIYTIICVFANRVTFTSKFTKL